jgi:trehalose 6-phosphate phosphatase
MKNQLFDHLGAIKRRVVASPHLALFLDFDGTLASYADAPDQVTLAPYTRRVLRRLSRREDVTAAIVSGRERSDLQARIRVAGLIYAGNQGMEISGPGFVFVEPRAAACSEELHAVAVDLAARLQPLAGVWVEDKGLTITVHFRLARVADVEKIRRAVEDAAVNMAGRCRVEAAEKSYDIRPAHGWDKAAAVRWILKRHCKEADAVVIYIGDDGPDEAAFAALPEGITVRVGPAKPTAARYVIHGPPDVARFLQWLTGAMLVRRSSVGAPVGSEH